jgi:hypothetical protein
MTRIIIKAVPSRQWMVDYLVSRIPHAEVCMDRNRDAFDTFNRALAMAGEDAAVHMEEDVILTRDFLTKIESVIAARPNTFIQFFSMRGADLTVGSRWDRDFLMNQCFYAPPGYSRAILEYYPSWSEKWLAAHPNGTDLMVRHFLKSRRERYWIHVPSLVDHRIARSEIDHRRSSRRQSLTFTDPMD